MKCPHCEEEISGSPCPGCGESVYGDDANYCSHCGIALKESAPPVSRDESFFDDEEDIDFDNRELCPDGTCTGIIVDGRCTECGKAVGHEEASPGEAEASDADAGADVPEGDETTKENKDA